MYGDIPVLCRCLVWLTILACLLIMIAITLIGYFKAGILTQDQISSAVRPVESWGVGVGEGARCFAQYRGVLGFFFLDLCCIGPLYAQLVTGAVPWTLFASCWLHVFL